MSCLVLDERMAAELEALWNIGILIEQDDQNVLSYEDKRALIARGAQIRYCDQRTLPSMCLPGLVLSAPGAPMIHFFALHTSKFIMSVGVRDLWRKVNLYDAQAMFLLDRGRRLPYRFPVNDEAMLYINSGSTSSTAVEFARAKFLEACPFLREKKWMYQRCRLPTQEDQDKAEEMEIDVDLVAEEEPMDIDMDAPVAPAIQPHTHPTSAFQQSAYTSPTSTFQHNPYPTAPTSAFQQSAYTSPAPAFSHHPYPTPSLEPATPTHQRILPAFATSSTWTQPMTPSTPHTSYIRDPPATPCPQPKPVVHPAVPPSRILGGFRGAAAYLQGIPDRPIGHAAARASGSRIPSGDTVMGDMSDSAEELHMNASSSSGYGREENMWSAPSSSTIYQAAPVTASLGDEAPVENVPVPVPVQNPFVQGAPPASPVSVQTLVAFLQAAESAPVPGPSDYAQCAPHVPQASGHTSFAHPTMTIRPVPHRSSLKRKPTDRPRHIHVYELHGRGPSGYSRKHNIADQYPFVGSDPQRNNQKSLVSGPHKRRRLAPHTGRAKRQLDIIESIPQLNIIEPIPQINVIEPAPGSPPVDNGNPNPPPPEPHRLSPPNPAVKRKPNSTYRPNPNSAGQKRRAAGQTPAQLAEQRAREEERERRERTTRPPVRHVYQPAPYQ